MGFATKFRQVVAATAAACCYAAPAAADTVSFEDNVFRYRAETRFSLYFNLDLQLAPQGAGFPTHVEALAEPAAVRTGPGCNAVQVVPVLPDPMSARIGRWRVVCPLSAPVGDKRVVRYRLSLTRAEDRVNPGGLEKGVVFAGGGQDEIYGDRLYGGPGPDTLEGNRVFGGPGVDRLNAAYPYDVRAFVMHGGPGDDELSASGRAYGGPGADFIEELSSVGDMFVGGPGRDTVLLWGDRAQDITRVRGGGADKITCEEPIDRIDVLLVDRSDHVGARCRRARVLLSGRPRRLWP